MYEIRHFTSFVDLPDKYSALLAESRSAGLFFAPGWFAHLMRHVFDEQDRFRLYAVEEQVSGHPLLLAPLCLSRAAGGAGMQVASSVNHPENFAEVALAFASGLRDRRPVLSALFRYLKAGNGAAGDPPCDIVRLCPVEDGSPVGELVRAALRDAGFWTQRYLNSYNRFEETQGIDYATYFANRSANLRYSVRRRQRGLAKAGQVETLLYCDPEGLDQGVADYFTVALASWKVPSTMVGKDSLEMIHLAAQAGCLRLGILRLDGKPVATQFWIVSGGVAHCARLAYDEAYKPLAPGVVLTDFMIAHVVDRDRVAKIDFGYGTEDYKGGWMKSARDYFGFMAFNPATRHGLVQAMKHILGQPVKRAARTGLQFLLRFTTREAASAGGERR